MNQQQMDNYLENVKGILKQVKNEVKKLHFKQEEFNRREQDIIHNHRRCNSNTQITAGKTTRTTNTH